MHCFSRSKKGPVLGEFVSELAISSARDVHPYTKNSFFYLEFSILFSLVENVGFKENISTVLFLKVYDAFHLFSSQFFIHPSNTTNRRPE